MPNCVFSIIIMKKFQVLSHLRSHSKNTPTRTHFARTIPRGFAPLSHLKYRTHVCDRTSARTHVHTLHLIPYTLHINRSNNFVCPLKKNSRFFFSFLSNNRQKMIQDFFSSGQVVYLPSSNYH